MIRPLRRWHGTIWQVAVIALPLLLAVALYTRPPTLRGRAPAPRAVAGESVWPGLSLALRREPSGLRVRALGPLPAPDLLLYATTEPAGKGQRLPAGAAFLGSVSAATQVVAPPPAASDQLILYSLAHGEVVGSAPVPSVGP